MRILTDEGQELRDEFENHFKDNGCSCHIHPPCGHCTHPGNPANLFEDERMWTEIPDEPMPDEDRGSREGDRDD